MTSSSSSSYFNSQIIPKELLKFRLDKQLGRLKQVIESCKNENRNRPTENGEEEDKFQLYQRILSWFIMGRLAKSEYDGILENILITKELIGKNYLFFLYIHLYLCLLELHNSIIELLRAIYCDSNSILITTEINSNSSISGSLDSFLNSFEFNLLPPEERFDDLEEEKKKEKEKDINNLNNDNDLNNLNNLNDLNNLNNLNSGIVVINSRLSTRKFITSIEKMGLTTSEEALISEAMRNPIHVQRNVFNVVF